MVAHKVPFNILALLLLFHSFAITYQESCDANNKHSNCSSRVSPMNLRYIFYDVNPPEGFNLRRDVYMRMAVLAKNLKDYFNSYLILPPWPHLYHWQSEDIHQERLPWGLFFDIKSLQSFAPVLEMNELFQIGINSIDQVYILQHFKDMFETGNFEDRMEIQPCVEKKPYKRVSTGYVGYFWGYNNITAKKVDCLSYHGSALNLIDILKKTKANTIMFDHAEVALHDRFGDKTYWDARKSMQFADHLVSEAIYYQKKYLNWTESDTAYSSQTNNNSAGGNYLCVHMRRKDFLYGHSKNVPSIQGACKQIESSLHRLGLNTVFVATDASNEEKNELKSRLPSRRIVLYSPSNEIKRKFKDGGVAIIEQIICSNARHFIGTHESTFSFRIQEEREIKGFPSESTFNRLCGDSETKCRQPSQWKMVE